MAAGWAMRVVLATAVLAMVAGCATPETLRRPVGGPAMPEPRAGDPLPVSALAEPTGEPPITLPMIGTPPVVGPGRDPLANGMR